MHFRRRQKEVIDLAIIGTSIDTTTTNVRGSHGCGESGHPQHEGRQQQQQQQQQRRHEQRRRERQRHGPGTGRGGEGGADALHHSVSEGGEGGGSGGEGGGGRYAHRGTPASCKMCIHVDVCKAYQAALATNDQFAMMRFIKMDTPIIAADSLAQRCTKYAPPNVVGLAEGLKHELR